MKGEKEKDEGGWMKRIDEKEWKGARRGVEGSKGVRKREKW